MHRIQSLRGEFSAPTVCLAQRPTQVAIACATLAAWAFSGLASAQTVAAKASESGLSEVTVSAGGLGQSGSEMTTPASVLEGQELVLRREATLGETLSAEPGIHSSHFGAGASRPIIRGMDGPRVKILSDGAELHDASSISPDHAVAMEPMLATQIEVLRGPSALIHGGGAMGGVVNILDNKIPTRIPEKGYEGSAELRYGSGAREKAGAFSLTGGAGQVAVHVEGLTRDADDYRVGGGWAGGSRVGGSFNRGDTGSLGLSWIGAQGYLGAAYTRQSSRYGLPGHSHDFEGCHTHGNHLHCGSHDGHDHDEHDHDHEHAEHEVPVVDMVSERLDMRGELRQPFAGVAAVRFRAGVTDYRHDEIEEGAIATTFTNKAHDARVEIEHQPIGGLRGVLGMQTTNRKFSAIGEEAYVQPTETRRNSLFLLEEYRWQDWRFEGALRHERQTAEALTSGVERKHSGTSASLGAVWQLAPGYQLASSLTHSSRLPTVEELYAKGLHMATSTYERGNADLQREKSKAWDLSLRKTAGPTTFSVSAFQHRVNNYIYGRTLDEHDGLQLLQYSQADARFTGLEGQVRQRLGSHWGVTLFGDTVRARLDAGGTLPRIPSARVGLRVDARWNGWQGMAEWVQVGKQNRVAAFESATDGYGMLNLSASYQMRTAGGTPWQIYAKARNLTDRLGYAHTSFIKSAAPLMGRNITVGVKMDF